MSNVNSSFTFGTLNYGSSWKDYGQQIPNKKTVNADNKEQKNFHELGGENEFQEKDNKFLDSIANLRNKLLSETAKDLARLADVYALQEVMGNDREDIKVFIKEGFQIIRLPRANNSTYTDTAIAIHPKKFHNISDRSFKVGSVDFAAAVATENATGKKIAFISGHISGFNIDAADEKSMKEGASQGDHEIEGLINVLNEYFSDCDSIFIGADMNAIYERYPARFKLLEDAGFVVHRTHQSTNKMSRRFGDQATPKTVDRELDYIFVKHKKIKKSSNRFVAFLCSLFKKETIKISKIDNNRNQLTLNPNSSPSDHLPVFLKVEEKNVKGTGYNPFHDTVDPATWMRYLTEVESAKKRGEELYIVETSDNQITTSNKVKKDDRKLSEKEITWISVNKMHEFEKIAFKSGNPDDREVYAETIKLMKDRAIKVIDAKENLPNSFLDNFFVVAKIFLSFGFYLLKEKNEIEKFAASQALNNQAKASIDKLTLSPDDSKDK